MKGSSTGPYETIRLPTFELFKRQAKKKQNKRDDDDGARGLLSHRADSPPSTHMHEVFLMHDARSDLGQFLEHKHEDIDFPEQCCHDATVNPPYAIAHNNLGNLAQVEVDTYYNLGLLLHFEREYVNCAEQCYRNAIEIDPAHAGAHNNLGHLLYFERGDVNGAEQCCRTAIEVDPTFAAPHHGLGYLLQFERGDVDGAEQCYRNAVELDPTNAAACAVLGNLLAEQHTVARHCPNSIHQSMYPVLVLFWDMGVPHTPCASLSMSCV